MRQKLFNIYFFLFFFLMINREFVPFGLDLRIIGFILGGILFIWGGKDIVFKKQRIDLEAIDYFIVAFFVLSFLSNIIWFFNGLTIRFSQFIVIFVSYAFNFLSYLVFRMHLRYINLKKFNLAMTISALVLVFSILMAYIDVDIKTFLMSGCKGYVSDLATNFIGGKYRYGGFAEDPNYASLFIIFGIATHLYCIRKQNKRYNWLYLGILVFCFLLSASKTTLIAIFPALFLCLLKDNKFSKFIKVIWMPIMILGPIIFILSKFEFFSSMVTMTQRFTMWGYALDLFSQSPFVGNGFTAFRSYADMIGWWYVQCHSTIFQMLSETGMVSILLFGIILANSLFKNNKYLTFLVALFSVYMITTETAYHVYFVFVLAILPMIIKECDYYGKGINLRR